MVRLLLLLLAVHGNLCTDRPIIGLLSQAVPASYGPDLAKYSSYITASYVKWLEAAGARVVPVLVDTSGGLDQTDYFKEVFAGVNGLFIPGGADKTSSDGYYKASQAFYNMAIKANDEGDIFPIWGTCLGFEMLGLLSNNGSEYLTRCNSLEQYLPLELEDGWEGSRLLGEAPSSVLEPLTSLNITSNFHHWCLTRENFTRFGMDQFWQLLSVNHDLDGLEFVSSMEARAYPFYAVQFHPEMNSYEWSPQYPNIIHSREATRAMLYLIQFFVDKTRLSSHAFPTRANEESHLIYNYQAVFTGREEIDNENFQMYFFN